MDFTAIDAFVFEIGGDAVDGHFGFAEDDGGLGFFVGEEVEEEVFFIPVFDGEVFLVNEGDGQGAGDGDEFSGIGLHELAGKGFDGGIEGGGDEDGLVGVWDFGEDFADIVAEADIEHAVDFIEDDEADVGEVDFATVFHIHDAAGGADEDMGGFFDGAGLFADGFSADDADGPEGGVFAQFVDFAGDLGGEFAGGDEDEGLEGDGRIGELKDGKGEGRGFACAGFGLADDILATEDGGDEFGLDVGGVGEAGIGDALEDVWSKVKGGKGGLGVEDFEIGLVHG